MGEVDTYFLKRECKRICEELRYGETLYYAFMKLDSALYYLADILGKDSDVFLNTGRELIKCVKSKVLPIMANYTIEEIKEHLKKPQFSNLRPFNDELIRLAEEARNVPAKIITRKYPGPPPGWGEYEVIVRKPTLRKKVLSPITSLWRAFLSKLNIKQIILIVSILFIIFMFIFFILTE